MAVAVLRGAQTVAVQVIDFKEESCAKYCF
jgi:hypothetical protein